MSLDTNSQMAVLMDINQLSYSPPIDGSLANSRQGKKYAFTPLNYNAGGQPQIQINSGSDYVSGPTSFISIKPTVTNAGGVAAWNKVGTTDGNGSAFNLIREFQLSHRSGDVLDRTDHLNSLIAELVRYAFDSSYSEKFAQVFGYSEVIDLSVLTDDARKVYALPLFLLSGMFAQKALIPSHLLAGAKMKIQLETASRALVVDAGVAGYSLDDVSLVLDSVDLFDAAKKALSEQAANTRTQGLQYPYYSWFQLRKSESTSRLNFDINISAAKTMMLLIKTRTAAVIDSSLLNSMAPDIYRYKNWRARIGALSLPQHLVQDSAESYMITQEAFSANPDRDMLNPSRVQCGVSYARYSSQTLDVGAAVIAISMEKSTIVALSGEPTSNNRLLNFSCEYVDDVPRVIDGYIKHLRVANVMMDNVVVDK